MKTKIVYSVVSGKDDIYLPQALVAGYTARRYNPMATILLVMDQETKRTADEHLSSIKNYFTDIVVRDVPPTFTQVQKSRYLKTTLRECIEGDFIFIDTDTVITSDISEIDSQSDDIAAVLDRHINVENHIQRKEISLDIANVGLNIKDLCNKYFNSGVIFAKDTPIAHKLFKCWNNAWNEARKKGQTIDQPSLAKANMECGYPIAELSGEWNCQLSDNFLSYLSNAKILHYFASNKKSPYKLYDNNIFMQILKDGDVSEKLKCQLEKPKTFFTEEHSVIMNEDIMFNKTFVHLIYQHHYWVFKLFEYISKFITTKR